MKQNFTLPPYPAIPGLVTILKAVEARNPKAKDTKPEDFVDMGIVQELDKSGFIANAMRQAGVGANFYDSTPAPGRHCGR